jgi:hypothetical protein
MTNNPRAEHTLEHREIAGLIPWYVNATLVEHDRQRVEAHLENCAICREDLALERRIFARLNAETAIEYMPAASLKRFQARLDAAQTLSPPPDGVVLAQPREKSLRRTLMAASVAVLAITSGVLMADRWLQFRGRVAAPSYRTVTDAAPRPRDEVIRAVFSPALTVVEMQAILEESQLKIVAGPTEAGVYSLAAKSNLPVRSSLTLLRQHSGVRFAEATGLDPAPGHSP